MFNRIVKPYRAFGMRSCFREVANMRQGNTHKAMSYHERNRCPLPLGERQNLRRKLAHERTIECDEVYDPEAVEHRE